jgi:hypothetical protein
MNCFKLDLTRALEKINAITFFLHSRAFKTRFALRFIKVVVGYVNVDAAPCARNTNPATKARRKRTFTVVANSGGQFKIIIGIIG